MSSLRQDPRIKHGLIPILVAMRVQGERERRAAEAARKAGQPVPPKKKRGWFG
ncbi:hypothetical protein [Brevundimonas lenta]|uniref:Putative membrane protein n=1 Tax=Brevundimonas lenta TaxID=424796 RepID=A0A7W6JG16_9CAUL|nr:hypothetical protein [Brevundimonas lenta]MBB4083427.1 putative membrane protein [Brevundimonas lenta]